MRPWVERQVPELGARQIGDGDHCVDGGVGLGSRLGGLDLRVHGLDEAAQPTPEVPEMRQCGRTRRPRGP